MPATISSPSSLSLAGRTLWCSSKTLKSRTSSHGLCAVASRTVGRTAAVWSGYSSTSPSSRNSSTPSCRESVPCDRVSPLPHAGPTETSTAARWLWRARSVSSSALLTMLSQRVQRCTAAVDVIPTLPGNSTNPLSSVMSRQTCESVKRRCSAPSCAS